jgi:hypothetical protein
MVQKYEKVYLKPDQGRKSRGIIRVEKVQEGLYLLRGSDSEKQLEFENIPVLWSAVRDMTSGTRHVMVVPRKSPPVGIYTFTTFLNIFIFKVIYLN